jgi:hypothetical protein
MPPKAAALSREEIEPQLQYTGLSAQDIRSLLRQDEWRAIDSRNQQLLFLCDFAQEECGITLSAAIVARVFAIEASQVWKVRSKAKKQQKLPHRPPALLPDQEDALVALIETGYERGNFVTQRDVLNFVEDNFGKCLTYGWLRSFLSRNASRICRKTVSPQEQTRLEIPRDFLDRYIALIREWVPLVPAELIFNIDECGFSDWEERKEKPVLIPAAAQHTTLHYPVNRQIRHQTLVCCVTAAGDAYCPLLVSADPHVIDVFDTGIRNGIDLKIEISHSPYVNQQLFEKYLDEIVLPAVVSNRELEGCRNKPAILFCDNCSAHCSNDILQKLARHGVLLITYPPHTSHVFQVLDVLLFGILKRAKKYQRRDDTLRKEVDHVLRLFRAYEQATASTTIRASWGKTGFEYQSRDNATYLVINEAKVRQSNAFQEIWLFDYHPARLSPQRLAQKWGWLNEHLFRRKERRFLKK